MYFSRFICLFFLLTIFLSVSISAQNSPTESQTTKENAQKEREKKAITILERTVNQTSFLKLPDNRALVYASAGDLVWEGDEKRGRQLFRQAANELVQSNSMPLSESGNPFLDTYSNTSPRRQILMTIAKYDAEMALELLLLTRPPKVAAALAASMQEQITNQNQKKTSVPSMEENQNKALVAQEISLEQILSTKVAESNPQKAVRMLRESIEKNGVTNSAFSILEKVNKKDHKLAIELAEEIAQKLSETDFSKKEDNINISSSFLKNYYIGLNNDTKKERKTEVITISEKQARDLANHIADYFMKEASKNSIGSYFQSISITPVLEKVIPEKSLLLRQNNEKLKKAVPEEFIQFADNNSNTDKSDAERGIENANKLPTQVRGSVYEGVINRAIVSGELDKVHEALLKTPLGKERDEALNYLDSKVAEQKIKDGKFDEAKKIVDNLTSNKEKVERLVQLAIGFRERDIDEDTETAKKLMNEAELLIDDVPQDEDGVDNFLRIASGYAHIEPNRAFSMLDTFSFQANDIMSASALLAKYNKRDRSFTNGELLLARGLPRIGNTAIQYGKELNLLAQEDINRLEGITSKFQRDDARILLQLYIVQAFFNKKIGLEGSENSNFNEDLILNF